MSTDQQRAHPWMANSGAQGKKAMLDALQLDAVESLFEQIPEDHRLARPLDLPPALSSELELRRHLRDLLAKNQSCEETLNFLGAGCWQHYVPAVCDEIVGRAEFLTPVWGTPSSDGGRNQALFEWASQLGELVGMDFVGLPVYSFGCAAGHAIRMAARINGRREVLVPRSMDPERLDVIRTYCEPQEMQSHIQVTLVDYDEGSGELDLDDLRAKLSRDVTAVYLENPSFLGMFESAAGDVAALARKQGAETIVGVDPLSLGVAAAPSEYGADLVVGSTQQLGVHMNCGGGAGGFIASRDEERYAREYPTLMLSICPPAVDTARPGFSMTLMEQSSYGARELGKDWTGNSVYLWAIANAVYMAMLGRSGFRELGKLILSRSHHAAQRLNELPGVKVRLNGPFFKEFVVGFDETGKSVAEVNRGLRERGIFGGKDLSPDFPELGQSALYCVTEVHTPADIDRLVTSLSEELDR